MFNLVDLRLTNPEIQVRRTSKECLSAPLSKMERVSDVFTPAGDVGEIARALDGPSVRPDGRQAENERACERKGGTKKDRKNRRKSEAKQSQSVQ